MKISMPYSYLFVVILLQYHGAIDAPLISLSWLNASDTYKGIAANTKLLENLEILEGKVS